MTPGSSPAFHAESLRFTIYFVCGCLLLATFGWFYYQREEWLLPLAGGLVGVYLLLTAITTVRRIVLYEDRLIVQFWFWPTRVLPYSEVRLVEHQVSRVTNELGEAELAGVRIHLPGNQVIAIDRIREGTAAFFDALREIAPSVTMNVPPARSSMEDES